jgi:hypothetical protein
MLRAHGVDRFCAVLRRLGVTTLTRPGEHYGLALILGGAEGTLWDVTGVYSGLARSALAPTDDDARGAFFPPTYRLDDRSSSRVWTSGSLVALSKETGLVQNTPWEDAGKWTVSRLVLRARSRVWSPRLRDRRFGERRRFTSTPAHPV